MISNMLIILALKMRWKTVLNNAETNIFRWDMLFLAVPAGSVSRCFVTYSKNLSFWRGTDKCLTSLKMNSIHFEGRRSLQTTKKTFDSPHYMPCLCWHSIHLVASSGVDATPCEIYLKLVFDVAKELENGAEWPFTTNPHFVCNVHVFTRLYPSKTELLLIFWCWPCVWSRDYRMNFDWLS